MLKRSMVIFTVLILTFNFFVLDNPLPDLGGTLDTTIDDQNVVENPADEPGTGSGAEAPDAGYTETLEPEPVTLVKPGGEGDYKPLLPATRGIWNRSGMPMFEDDFEGAFPGANWYVFDNLSNASNNYSDFWGLNNSKAHNGSWSVYCAESNATGDPGPAGNTSGNNSGYDNHQKSWMISGPYDLSDQDMLNARVTFWYWMQTEIASDGENDSFIWAASKDNTTFNGLRIRGNLSAQWNFREYYLNNYDNQGGSLIGESQVWIAFIFSSNASNIVPAPYNYTGVWLDDVKLENYTNRAPLKPTGLNVSGPNIRRIILDKPVFNWTVNDLDTGVDEGPTGYHIQVGTDDNWTSVEKWNKNVTGYFFPSVVYGSSNKLDDGQTYWFRVKVRDKEGVWSPWSDPLNFSINDPPSAPLVLSPAKSDLWEGGSQHYINWTNSTNDDNGTDDIILINISYSINGGIDYIDIVMNETNNGSYLWTLPDTVESEKCKVKVTAYDGYEETSAVSNFFNIDSLVPVINNIIVTSDKTWYYVQPGINGSGGTVWFNSLPGEGGDQKLMLNVVWTDVSPTKLEGDLAFGDTPVDDDSTPYTLNYTVDINSTDQLGIKIRTVDYFGRITEATIDFRVDNVDPTPASNVLCRPDSFTDLGNVDDDNQVFVTYTAGTDSGVGVYIARMGTEDPPTQTENTSDGRGLVTSYLTNLNVTIFVAMVDHVGNIGPAVNDTIIIDLLAPIPPDIFSKTHPDNTKYYNNPDPEFNWTWPQDLSGVEQFSVKLNEVSSYIPDPGVDTVLNVNFTSYSGVKDGVNFFHVRSYDRAGFWGLGSESFKFFIDTSEPTFKDDSGTGTTTGDKLLFKAQGLDNGAGVDNTSAKLYWKYFDDIDFTEVEFPLVDDLFQLQITTDVFRAGSIDYYFTVNDRAIPPNSGRYPLTGLANVKITDNRIPWIVWGTNDTMGTTGDPVNISVRSSDNVKPARAVLYIDGWEGSFEMVENMGEPNNFSTQLILPINSVEPLKYFIEVYDAQNNMVRHPDEDFLEISVIDNDPPTVRFITGNLSKKDEVSVTVTVIPEDNVETALVLTAKFYSKRTDALFSMVPVETVQGFQYIFELSSEIKSDVDYYVLVEDTKGNGIRVPADENEFFHIYIPAVLEPNGGEILNKTKEVRWHAPSISGASFKANLSYSDDGGVTWVDIVNDLPNAVTYQWDTTKHLDAQSYKIKLELLYSNGFFLRDISDNDFIIYNPDPPSISVKYPNPGGRVRDDVEVQWESTDPDPMDTLLVDIHYMYLGKGTNASESQDWKILVENQGGTGSYIWQTLKYLDGNYKLRFILSDNVLSPVAVEVNPVIVYNPDAPMITVLTPKTNEVLSGKDKITWIATDADDEELTISIYLRRISDKNQSLIAIDLPNTGEYDIDFSKFKDGIYEVVVEVSDGSILEPVEAKSGVFDIEHEAELNLTTWIIVSSLLAFMIIVVLMLFIMARQRKRMLERAKLKKAAQIKKRKTGDMPGGIPGMESGVGLPGMAAPGAMGMPQQLPGGGYHQAAPGEPGSPQLPQLPPTTEGGDQAAAGDDGVVTGEVVDGEVATDEELEGGRIADAGSSGFEFKGPSDVRAGFEAGAGTPDEAGVEGVVVDGEVVTGAAAAAKKPKAKKSFCGECGASIGETDVVCVHCGRFQK